MTIATSEAAVTTNAWAFLLWARATRGLQLDGWHGLQRFSAAEPVAFCAAVADFARLGPAPRIARHRGRREALALLSDAAPRQSFSRDDLLAEAPPAGLPADVLAALRRPWRRDSLARALTETLLHDDIRPDDRVLVAGGAAWPALGALAEGAAVLLYAGAPACLAAAAAAERASVVLAPADWQGAAFAGRIQPDRHAALRLITLLGGPWAADDGNRPGCQLRARDGQTIWGNPLEPAGLEPSGLEPGPALFAVRPPGAGPDRP